MKKKLQRRVAALSTVAGLLTAVSGGVLIARHFLTVEIVANIILVETPRETSYWQLTKTPQGSLIRAASGRYVGWYLDADESISQEVIGSWENNRFLVLSRERRDSSYWQITTKPDGDYIHAATGPFQGLYLDIAAGDEVIERDGLRFRRNLLIGDVQFPWKVTQTESGYTIRAGGSEEASLDYDADVGSEYIWKRSPEERRRDAEREFHGRSRAAPIRAW